MSDPTTVLGNQVSTGGNVEGSSAGAGTPPANTGGTATGTTGTPSWRDTLPDDLKSNGTLANFQDVGALAKSYLHAQSLVGKKGVFPPTDKSSDEEWTAFYKSVGQPELAKFELNMPKDVKFDETVVGQFKEIAHKSGLLPKQASGILDWYVKSEQARMTSQATANETKVKEGLDGLQKEWGQGYDKQIALARLGVKDGVGADFQAYLDKTGLGNDPMVIKAMAKVGALIGEDKLRGDGSGKFGKTRAEAQSEIDKVMGDLSGPLFHSGHADHKRVLKNMEALYKQAAGQE